MKDLRERCEKLADELWPYLCEEDGYEDRLEELESFARELLQEPAEIIRMLIFGCDHKEKNGQGKCYLHGCDEATAFLHALAAMANTKEVDNENV